MMKENIHVDWSPKKVDKFLQDKHELSLYPLMVSIDDIFSTHDYRTIKVPTGTTGHPTGWREFWHDNIQLLNRLKTYNRNSIDILKKFHNETRKYLDPFIIPFNLSEDFNLEIDDITKIIEKYKDLIENYLLATKTRKGGEEEKKNIVFLTWSHFFKANNKSGVDFKRIISLMNWFSSRINLHDLKETENSELNFRRVLSRYRGKKPKPRLVSIIDDYKERFLVPIQYRWLEQGIAQFEPDDPLIMFSNGEKLTPKDCLNNNPEYESDMESGTFFCFDFSDFKNDVPPEYLPKHEIQPSRISVFISQHLLEQYIPNDTDS